jgi:uncharacterized protein (DUF362 family)
VSSSTEVLFDPRVAVADLRSTSYSDMDTSGGLSHALNRMAELLGWGMVGRGPFGAVVHPGAKVLVKPNWVLHENQGPWGIEPLVTHASVVKTIVEELLRGQPSSVSVGDAPIQGCDFDRLLDVTGLAGWCEQLLKAEPRFGGIRDFRRTKCVVRGGLREAFEDQVPLDHFILFDLGSRSLLEPVTGRGAAFRVTQYDPAQLVRTHGPGRHQYLIARDVIEADVIVNLPKLKTHKKAGLTCALKNLIGINGNKEYLPHHRLGGSSDGGDCYPGTSWIKRTLESAYDRLNHSPSAAGRRAWAAGARILLRAARVSGDRFGVEGSWSGNDTIWRTCLDLNRILLYGRADGTLADEPQRQVIHVVDAIMAGQGDGPLSPQPFALGLLLAGGSAAAVDWVAAELLGYDPQRIPIAREAFGNFRWPLSTFPSSAIQLVGALGAGAVDQVLASDRVLHPISYPSGWLDAVRVRPDASDSGRSTSADELSARWP